MHPLGSGGLQTGTQTWAQEILEGDDSSDFKFGIRVFEAGSRTKFHKHTGDQILIITEGTGSVGTDNETLTVVAGVYTRAFRNVRAQSSTE